MNSLHGSIKVKDLNFYYGDHQALKNVSIAIEPAQIVAMIGPSGCGKSTLIRVFNRMNDLIPFTRVEGEVLVDGKDIYDKDVDVVATASGGPSEIIEEGISGFLVDVGDKENIAEKVVMLLKDSPRREAMGGKGRERIRRCFNLKDTVCHFNDVFEKLLDRERA